MTPLDYYLIFCGVFTFGVGYWAGYRYGKHAGILQGYAEVDQIRKYR